MSWIPSHGHVITVTHHPAVVEVECRCGGLHRWATTDGEAGLMIRSHRRHVFPRFRR